MNFLLAIGRKDLYDAGHEQLPLEKRVQILSMLCEGLSMRSISRVADVSINTVAKLLVDAGKACAAFHEAKVRGVKARRVQVDEIWSFTAAKQKNVATMKEPVARRGRYLDLDRYRGRHKIAHSLAGRWSGQRIRHRLHGRSAGPAGEPRALTSDGHKAYLEAVEGAFGGDVDYASW